MDNDQRLQSLKGTTIAEIRLMAVRGRVYVVAYDDGGARIFSAREEEFYNRHGCYFNSDGEHIGERESLSW